MRYLVNIEHNTIIYAYSKPPLVETMNPLWAYYPVQMDPLMVPCRVQCATVLENMWKWKFMTFQSLCLFEKTNLARECVVNGTECYDGWVWVLAFVYLFYCILHWQMGFTRQSVIPRRGLLLRSWKVLELTHLHRREPLLVLLGYEI